jgi:hypothetical protein
MISFFTSKKILKTFKWFAIIFVVFLLQLFLMPTLSVYAVVPNLPLTLIIIVALNFGFETSLPFSLIFILLQKNFLYDNTFFISWLIAPFLAVYTYPQLALGRYVLLCLQVALCTVYVELINALLFSFKQGLNIVAENYWIIILSPLMNALLALPLIWLLDVLFVRNTKHSRVLTFTINS